MEKKNHKIYANLGVGIFLLTAGVLLMLTKFDLLEIGSVWDFWPLIIIAIGIGRLLDAEFHWEYRKAFWMLYLGSWLQICELNLFGLSYRNSWPILLIGVGIGILWKSLYPTELNFAKDRCHGI